MESVYAILEGKLQNIKPVIREIQRLIYDPILLGAPVSFQKLSGDKSQLLLARLVDSEATARTSISQ